MSDVALQHPTKPREIVRLNSDARDWDRLPKQVKVKLQGLRRERDDAWRAWRAIADERQHAWDAKAAVETRLKTLTGGRSDSAWYGGVQHARFQKLTDDDPLVVREKEKLEDLLADLGRLNPLVAERSHRSQQLNSLVRSAETYLNGLGAVAAIKIHKGSAPAQQKPGGPINAVERCRSRVRELNAGRHRIASAPWHSSEAKRRARAEIDALAERGRPSVVQLIASPDGSIYWAERSITDVVVASRLVTSFGDPQTFPLLAWLNREVLIQKIEQQIDEVADDQNALTEAERNEQTAEIDHDRLAVEREEEHWVAKAIEGGMNVLRRPDADPRAVLGLADEMPALKNS